MSENKGFIVKITQVITAVTLFIGALEGLARTPIESPSLVSAVKSFVRKPVLQDTHPEMFDTCWFHLAGGRTVLHGFCLNDNNSVRQTLYKKYEEEGKPSSIFRCVSHGTVASKNVDLIFDFQESRCNGEHTKSLGAFQLTCIEPDNTGFDKASMGCKLLSHNSSTSSTRDVVFLKWVDNLSLTDTCWQTRTGNTTATLCIQDSSNDVRKPATYKSVKNSSISSECDGSVTVDRSSWSWSFESKDCEGSTPKDFEFRCLGPSVRDVNSMSIFCMITSTLDDGKSGQDIFVFERI